MNILICAAIKHEFLPRERTSTQSHLPDSNVVELHGNVEEVSLLLLVNSWRVMVFG